MAQVTLKDVTKIYDGDVLAVEQADFQIPDEIVYCTRRAVRMWQIYDVTDDCRIRRDN